MYSNNTSSPPVHPGSLSEIAGHGSSPVVSYEGSGIYFLDNIEAGIWRLEVYPDVIPAFDPYDHPSEERISTYLDYVDNRMEIRLPDLGSEFSVKSLTDKNLPEILAEETGFRVSPGVYILSRAPMQSIDELPDKLKGLGLAEFHSPEPHPVPDSILTGKDRFGSRIPARRRTEISSPERETGTTPHLLLYEPERDYERTLAARTSWPPVSQTSLEKENGGKHVLRIFPGASLSIYIGDRMENMVPGTGYSSLVIKSRADAEGQSLAIKLAEQDGTAWGKTITVGPETTVIRLPLSGLEMMDMALIPLGFPGSWNKWAKPPEGRDPSEQPINLAEVERLQLHREPGQKQSPGNIIVIRVRLE
jgi:hypothetical protein